MRILIGAILTGIFVSTIVFFLSEKSLNPVLMFIVIITGIGLVILFISSMRNTMRTKTEEREFMMETMRELISQMKDKQIALDIFNENILQSVPSGVLSINKDGVITKVNEAGMNILKRSDIIGRHISEVIGEPFLKYILMEELIKREEVPCEIGGRKVWLGFSISPLKDRNKNIIGKLVTFTDITEFKELQSRMKLKERLESLGEMAAGIAHELRNPMAVITGYANILRKKADPSIQELIEAIQKEISLMDSIIRDFLSFARYEEPNLVPVDMRSLVGDILKGLEMPEGIELKIEIEPSHGLMADETLIKQAIKNLIHNSIDVMPDGGILEIKGQRIDSSYRISISDTGKGIPPEIREKVFIPFFTTKDRGTGLGLSIVHKVVTAHGGEVAFDTSENGTTFKITLPLGSF